MLKFQGEEVIKIMMTYPQCADHNIKTLQLVQSPIVKINVRHDSKGSSFRTCVYKRA